VGGVKKHRHKILSTIVLLLTFLFLMGQGYQPQEQLAPPHVGAAATSVANPFDGRGLNDISPQGVDQSGVNDCYFEAAEASLANSLFGRKIIMGMIKTNRDGSYTVTFRGAPQYPVQVTQAELAQDARLHEVNDSQLWARIIQVAFLKYDHILQYGTGIYSVQIKGIPINAPVPASGVDQALALLTNQSVASDSFSPVSGDLWNIDFGHTTQANVALALEDAERSGEPVTALAADAQLAKIGFHAPGPLEEDHIFSVLKFKSGLVTVRNPWGYNNNPFAVIDTPGDRNYKPVDGITSLPNGRLRMSLESFMLYYTSMHFAGDNSTANDFANIRHDIAAGNVKYFVLDSLYTGCDLVASGLRSFGHGVEHGFERLVHDLNPSNW
jgi:hypothetical protein